MPTPARVIKLRATLPDEYVDSLAAKFVDESSFDVLIQKESVDVLKPDGSPLIKFRHNVLPMNLCKVAVPVMRRAARSTNNRGMAGGELDPTRFQRPLGKKTASPVGYYPLKADGTISKTRVANMVQSGLLGYFDRDTRFPYCRMTAFHLKYSEEVERAMALVKAINAVFKEESPERYAAQEAMVAKTNPDFYIRDTAFTTITVNRNFRTAVHKDAGDLKEGFGVMSVLQTGDYNGAFLVFPKYRVAVDMRMGDVCLADVHEWHGNTTFIGKAGRYERISLVLYYRAQMFECGSAQDELSRVKRGGNRRRLKHVGAR